MQPPELVAILSELNSSSPDIEGSWLVSIEGLLIAAALPKEMKVDKGSSLAAALFSRAVRTAKALQRGTMEQLLIKGKTGCILMVHAGDGALLVVLTKLDAKFGLIFLDVERAAQHIADEVKRLAV